MKELEITAVPNADVEAFTESIKDSGGMVMVLNGDAEYTVVAHTYPRTVPTAPVPTQEPIPATATGGTQ